VAQRGSDHIQRTLASVLPRRRIGAMARRLGVLQRRRKLDVVALVYTLVLGFSTGNRRTLAGLRRGYFRATGVRLAPSSFHARFTPQLTKLMRALAVGTVRQLAEHRPKLRAVFAPFIEVLAVDSSLLRLHDCLGDTYPSVWSNHTKAAIKLGAVVNVVNRGLKILTLTHGSRHDLHLLKPGAWMKGRLLVFDLAFYQTLLFKKIQHHGGYFLCRMKVSGNPIIIASHKPAHRNLVGRHLRDAQTQISGTVFDVLGSMTYMLRHKRRPFVTTHDVQWRCVGLYNAESDQWHRYVTNMPPQMMKAEHVSAVYAARWEVELLFRELKSIYRIGSMPSGNKHVTETLIYAALLSLSVSRALHQSMVHRYRLDPQRLPFDRWAVLLAHVAEQLLDIALSRRSRALPHRRIDRFLRSEAIDPNRARNPLPFRVQEGLYRAS